MASYVGGLTLRIRKQPLFVVVCLIGVFAIFQPYPSTADTALYLALLPLYRHVFPCKLTPITMQEGLPELLLTDYFQVMRYTFFSAATMLYTTFLGPAFYYLWIYAGSGNANFFYAITLVWSLGLIVVTADSLYAVLRDEWEFEEPEMVGKEVRQM